MISTLTGDSASVIENKDTVAKYNSARLKCENVYNVAHGQIVYIGAENGRAFVNVKCNPSEVLRYGNLKELTCDKGYYADVGAQLGVADGEVIFEYCTLWQGESNFPVRINNWTYYKQNPSDVLSGAYTVRKDGAQEHGYILNRDRVRFTTDAQKAVFGDNVLDKNDEIKEKQKWSTPKSISLLKKLGLQHKSKQQREEDQQNETDEDEDIGEG